MIASVVGIAGAVAKSLNGLEKVLGASAELHQLINETSDLQVILGSVQSVLWDSQGHDAVHGVTAILERAKKQLLDLDGLINYRLIKPGTRDKNGQVKVDRRQWLQDISRIKNLQQGLRDSRQNLAIGLANLTVGLASNYASRFSRIELKLQDISVQVEAPKQDTFQVQAQITNPSAQNNSIIGGSSPLPSQEVPLLPTHSINAEDLGRLTNLLQGNHGDSTGPETRNYPGEAAQKSPSTSIRISASLPQDGNDCPPWCSCACHIRRKLHTPSLLEPLLGRLFIGYKGITLVEQKCDQYSCRRHRAKTMKLSYRFPSWFFARMLSLSIMSLPSDGPQINLTFPRIVTDGAMIFEYATRGDVEGIKSLFRAGFASPQDVSSFDGRTALHVSPTVLETVVSGNTHCKHRMQ